MQRSHIAINGGFSILYCFFFLFALGWSIAISFFMDVLCYLALLNNIIGKCKLNGISSMMRLVCLPKLMPSGQCPYWDIKHKWVKMFFCSFDERNSCSHMLAPEAEDWELFLVPCVMMSMTLQKRKENLVLTLF